MIWLQLTGLLAFIVIAVLCVVSAWQAGFQYSRSITRDDIAADVEDHILSGAGLHPSDAFTEGMETALRIIRRERLDPVPPPSPQPRPYRPDPGAPGMIRGWHW